MTDQENAVTAYVSATFRQTYEQAHPVYLATWGGSVRRVVEDYCARRGVTYDLMKSRRRDKATVQIRQDLMLMLKEETSLSLPQIGRLFARDHTTVLHSIRRAKLRRTQT